MTWREQTVVRILLLICRMLADDSELKIELKHLANHVSVNASKSEGTSS